MISNGTGRLATIMTCGLISIGMAATVGMAVVFEATGKIPGELAGLAGGVVGSLGAGLVALIGHGKGRD